MKKTDGKIQKNAEISQFWHAIPLPLQRVDAEKKRHHRIFALGEVEDTRGGLEGQSIERASKTVQDSSVIDSFVIGVVMLMLMCSPRCSFYPYFFFFSSFVFFVCVFARRSLRNP